MAGPLSSAALLALAALFFSAATATATSPTGFINSSCRSTDYPTLCVQSLSSYAATVRQSPRQLAHAALTVCAARARSASALISLMSSTSTRAARREGGAVQDCMQTLGDSVKRLRRSFVELRRMGRAGSRRYVWHLNNAQTWVSAALTDENACLDSLGEDASADGVRTAMRSRILELARVTSNALAFINRLGIRT